MKGKQQILFIDLSSYLYNMLVPTHTNQKELSKRVSNANRPLF